MRASIKNYMDALRKQREERGEDGGFSLIELIVVVVILGILAANVLLYLGLTAYNIVTKRPPGSSSGF